MLSLLQNSNPEGLLLIALVAILGLGTAFYLIFESFKIGYLYIFDGGDASVPCLISFVLVYLTAVVVTCHGILVGEIRAEQPLLLNLVYVTLVAMMLRGRVVAFSTAKISPFVRTTMLFVGSFISVFLFVLCLALYNSLLDVRLTGYTFYEISSAMFSSLTCTSTPGWELPVVLGVGTLAIEAMIIIFDTIEKRSRNVFYRDILLVLATLIYFIFGVFQKQLEWTTETPIVVILYLFIIGSMTINFKGEAEGVIRRTSPVNTLIESVQKLIDKMLSNKTYTSNDKVRFNQILQVIIEDEEVRENLFVKNKLTFNRRRKRLIDRLEDVYAQYLETH
jgi:hypothetical protein